ncbi:PadR family transcriptional regulator [Nocardia blacklockiae]|uniref:PadR family transcriptional regulator n=1 Tax=Nocardia blacklockiae TaxID=480036 RepID=UPI001893ED52|nr:PadR family transcriptional regulator [Nocardia blacklockiae]MBF6171743.1 PadR family transcriptional regulator [Nocardia blacklockiae]
MAKKRKVGNLLALAVLAVLFERPMHRYEIAATLKERGKERDMDIKWGSLYTVVQNLEKHGFLEVIGSERDGARPERTIYRITDAGRTELDDWTRELVSTPEPEHHRFLAGLSIVGLLPPDDVIALLGERVDRLERLIATERDDLATQRATLPRLFLVESEFQLAMLEAEARWTAGLRDELASGAFPDVAVWRRMHADGIDPAEVVEMVERGDFTLSTDA